MSKIALQGDASGTGTFTIAAPNSNSNPTLTLPTSSGTVVVTGGAQTIEFAAGTAAAPSITFTGDTNTGIFSPGADTIAFSEGGVESMRIDSSGNVGIGTSALNFASGGGLIVYNNGGQARLILRNDLTGSASTDGFQIIQQGSESGNTNVNFQQAENSAMLFSTNATERMRIDSSGNVGIGITPNAWSTANGGRAIQLPGAGFWSYDTQNAYFSQNLYWDGSVRKYVVTAAATEYQQGAGIHQWFTAASGTAGNTVTLTERARITSGGNFYVGTTTDISLGGINPIALFNRSSGATPVVVTASLSNGQSSYFSTQNISGATRQCDIGVYKHAGITNSAGYIAYIEEEGTAQYTWVGNDGNFRISNDPNNIGTNSGTVVGTQTSDERLKNINGSVSYGLNEVLLLEPISFAFKDRADVQKIGFSAQQVQPIVPEAVYDSGECLDGYDIDPENRMLQTPKSDRTKLTMEYTQLIPVLVNAVKELKAITDAQTTRIEALEAEVAALKGQ